MLVFYDDKLMGLLPANRIGTQLFSHQGLSYGGLILNKTIRFNEVLEVFSQILKYLKENNIEELIIKTLPRIYHKLPSDELDYLLFKIEAELIRCDSLSVVVPKQMKLSRDRNNGLKRGIKNDLIVKEVKDFDDFWNQILIPNLKIKHDVSPVHSLEEISYLKTKFPKNIRQFNVYDNNILVAGTTIFESDLVSHSQYISANIDKNTLGSLDFLHNHLLQNVFNNKAYFDFGNSNENQGHSINKGLQYWKEGFGARSISHRFYKINTAKASNLNSVML